MQHFALEVRGEGAEPILVVLRRDVPVCRECSELHTELADGSKKVGITRLTSTDVPEVVFLTGN